jgi:hypothetical protein
MDSLSLPGYLLPTIIAIILLPATLYVFFPRIFRYFFICLGFLTYLSSPKRYTTVVDSCVVGDQWSVDAECKKDLVVFVVQMVVLAFGGMCSMAEAGKRVGRMRVSARGQGSV